MPKRKKKRSAGGLAKYRTFVNKKTASVSKMIRKAESRLNQLRRKKKAATKKAAAAFKRKAKKR